MKTFTKPLLLVGLLAGASVAAFAVADSPGDTAAAGERAGPRWGDRPGPHHSFAAGLSRHSQELGLTAQQLEAIKAAEDAARPELEKLAQAMHARREALRTQVDGILTAEQRTKLKDLRGQMRGEHGRRGPKGPPAPEGATPAK
jgi:Spy/CpxP family protein refolding chaperone